MRSLSVIFFLIVSLHLQSQTSGTILSLAKEKIEKLSEVSYKTTLVQTNPLNQDTDVLVTTCFFKKDPGDTMLGLHYYFSDADSGFKAYNGTEYFEYYPSYHNYILHYTLKDHPEKFRSVTYPFGIVPSHVTSSFTLMYSLFEMANKITSFTDKIKDDHGFSDTIAEGIPCYGFKLSGKSVYEVLLIRKSDTNIFRYISNFTGGKVNIEGKDVFMSQYTSVSFSDIEYTVPDINSLTAKEKLPVGVQILDEEPPFTETIKTGDVAPLWCHPELKSQKLLSLDSLKGKIVVMSFTSTWCIHCIEGSIALQELQKKYAGNDSVIIISLFSWKKDSREKVMAYCTSHEHNETVVYDASQTEKLYGIQGYPNFAVVDQTGKIAFFQTGYSKNIADSLQKTIEKCRRN